MKITLNPQQAPVFTPAELLTQLNRWIRPGTTGTITARCTFGGKIKELTLDVEQQDEAPAPEDPAT